MPVELFERWHLYGVAVPPVIALGTQYLFDRVVQIQDLPGPYYLRQLSTWDAGAGKSIRCRNGLGEFFMGPDFAPIDMVGTINNPLPIWPELEYPYDTAFRFDVKQIETEALADLWVLLHGAHKIAAPAGLSYYPEKVHETPYDHQITVTLGAAAVQKVPIYLLFNTPFAVRGLTCAVIADTSTFATTVVLRDENGQSFANVPLPYNMLFPVDGSNFPLTPSPELVIPAGRSYTLEVLTGAGVGAATIQFNFKGALLNAV